MTNTEEKRVALTITKGKCALCGRYGELMISNNPLLPTSAYPVCFNCISTKLKYDNLENADFFCRTFNLPFDPNLWLKYVKISAEGVFKLYTLAQLTNTAPTNLYYSGSTHDEWARLNKEWEKQRTFAAIMNKIEPIKDAYVERGRIKWGDKYDFQELIALDDIYSHTLKVNNIVNPLQKAAVRTLCKIQVDIDNAINEGATDDIKVLTASYASIAKEAGLDDLIAETHSSDITTVSSLYDYMEKSGWTPHFYQGFPKDEVDDAIDNIQKSNQRLIADSTGLGPLLDQLQKKTKIKQEVANQQATIAKTPLKDLEKLTNEAVETNVSTETDSSAINADLSQDADEISDVNVADEIGPKPMRDKKG